MYRSVDGAGRVGDSSSDKSCSISNAPRLNGPSQSPSRPPISTANSANSIRANYNETAELWGKAINSYSDQLTRQKTEVSDSSKKSALSVAKERLSSIVSMTEEPTLDLRPPSPRTREGSVFKPLETEYTFDRLAVPGQRLMRRSDPLLSRTQQLQEVAEERSRSRARTVIGVQDAASQTASSSTQPFLQVRKRAITPDNDRSLFIVGADEDLSLRSKGEIDTGNPMLSIDYSLSAA